MAPLTLDDAAGSDRLWPLALRLALLGFLVNCKPSEPFLTQYLLTNKHISSDDLEAHVYPWSTIGSFLLLLPAGLAAEHFGSRRVIFCGLLCREATRLLLILGEGVPAMAAMQLSYAGAVAVDAVYFAHIFAAAPPSAYAALTSIVYAAYHGGNVLGSLLGQGALALWPDGSQAEAALHGGALGCGRAPLLVDPHGHAEAWLRRAHGGNLVVALNHWHLEGLRLRSKLMEGTRLWLEPGSEEERDAVRAALMVRCEKVLCALERHKFASIFAQPVDAAAMNLPDYHDVVKHPMDLGTIREKLAAGKYRDPPAFKADCALAFDNCVKYNPKGTDAHVMGETMTQELEKKWVELGFC